MPKPRLPRDMILDLWADDVTAQAIARQIGCSAAGVEQVVGTARETGDPRAVRRRPRRGSVASTWSSAPPTLTGGEDNLLRKLFADGLGDAAIAKAISIIYAIERTPLEITERRLQLRLSRRRGRSSFDLMLARAEHDDGKAERRKRENDDAAAQAALRKHHGSPHTSSSLTEVVEHPSERRPARHSPANVDANVTASLMGDPAPGRSALERAG